MSELTPRADGRPPWSEFRSALEARGFRPARRLGQNFLLDENMVRAIVRDAGVGPGDFVLEVGAGCGFLTLHLLRAGVDLVSVEIDARLAEIARELLGGESRWRLIETDILAGKHALAPEVVACLPPERDWHLVANLPYAVSGPVLACASELAHPPRSMTVLVQREVALRIAAQPGTRDWGPLSIRLQWAYQAALVREVGSGLFWPRPQVESTVVRLVRIEPEKPHAEGRALSGLVDELFTRRRQTLLRVLSELCGDRTRAQAWLARAGLEPKSRAEDLALAALERLVRLDPRRA